MPMFNGQTAQRSPQTLVDKSLPLSPPPQFASTIDTTLSILSNPTNRFNIDNLKDPLVTTTCNLLLMHHPDVDRQIWATLRATQQLSYELVLTSLLEEPPTDLPTQAKGHIWSMVAKKESSHLADNIEKALSTGDVPPHIAALTDALRQSVDSSPLEKDALQAFKLLRPFTSQLLPYETSVSQLLPQLTTTFADNPEMLSFGASVAALQGDRETRELILTQIRDLDPRLSEILAHGVNSIVKNSLFFQTHNLSDSEYLRYLDLPPKLPTSPDTLLISPTLAEFDLSLLSSQPDGEINGVLTNFKGTLPTTPIAFVGTLNQCDISADTGVQVMALIQPYDGEALIRIFPLTNKVLSPSESLTNAVSIAVEGSWPLSQVGLQFNDPYETVLKTIKKLW